jgi:hypothetical protein
MTSRKSDLTAVYEELQKDDDSELTELEAVAWGSADADICQWG